MKYRITNYTVWKDKVIPSDFMELSEALSDYRIIYKQALNGFRDFPQIEDENGTIYDEDTIEVFLKTGDVIYVPLLIPSELNKSEADKEKTAFVNQWVKENLTDVDDWGWR